MGEMVRSSFARGWVPDADPTNGPVDSALRMDNLILDELGALSLRLGSSKINGVAFADLDVHSLYTTYISGSRYRMSGAGGKAYANGAVLPDPSGGSSAFAGSDDISFISWLGQILMARSTTKRKYDGTTVRNWGISMTASRPTVAGITADKKVFADGDSGETWTYDADSTGGAATFGTGYDGTANLAVELNPKTDNGLGLVRHTFASDTSYLTLDAGSSATDDSIISLWFYATNPSAVKRVTLEIAVNSASGNLLSNDRYVYEWLNAAYGEWQQTPDGQRPNNVIDFNMDPGGSGAANGWIRLTARRGDLTPPASLTSGKGWGTVRAIRCGVICTGGGSANLVKFQDIRISGGTAGAITGRNKKWKIVYVYNSGGATIAHSAPSDNTVEAAFEAQAARISTGVDASRDTQVNEIWLYRFIDAAGDYYRVKVKTGVSGTGSIDIDDDTLNDADAQSANIRLVGATGSPMTPPDNIISAAGPYFSRVYVLTSSGYLAYSQRGTVDDFLESRYIRVAGVDETPLWVCRSVGGLFVGTTKDIYTLTGTGAESPDGSIDFRLEALNIDNPPYQSNSVAQDGNDLVYLANDGWRVIQGSGSIKITGGTSLLYRGYTRHGVSPANLATGRFRAAIVKGQLSIITPEGASTTSSPVLHRYNFPMQNWYRHTYGAQTWRAIYREPDGTLIASDAAGFVWVLDTGTQDAGSNISVVLWTKADDDNVPFSRKDPQSLRVLADTGSQNCSVALHLDESGSAADTKTVNNASMGVDTFDLSTLSAWRTLQLRVTVSTASFRWESFFVGYNTLPAPWIGRVPESNAGYIGEKVLTGIVLRVCTRGNLRTFTPYFDGVAGTPFTHTTATDEPDTYTYQLPPSIGTVTATDISFHVDDTVELYDWEPVVLYQRPLGVKVWENKPLARSNVRRRFGGFAIQADTHGATATITPVLDGVDQTPLTFSTTDLLSVAKTFPTMVGRDLWCRITSNTAFNPLAVEPIIVETFPQVLKGQAPTTPEGVSGIKTCSGIQLRLCTLGQTVIATPMLDGVLQTGDALSITTDIDLPENHTIRFDAALEAAEIAIYFSGDVEIYQRQALISHVRPLGILAWDSGPIDLGSQELVWFREAMLKVRASDELTITPWFDGKAFPSETTVGIKTNVDTTVPIPVGKNYYGRQPRIVITSPGPFFPYWAKFRRRTTGANSDKEWVPVDFKMQTGA